MVAALVAFAAGCGGPGAHAKDAESVNTTAAPVSPTDVKRPSDRSRASRRLNSAVLTIQASSVRSDKLIECLRARVDPSELKVIRPKGDLVLVIDLRGRADRILQQVVTESLAACDPQWDDLVTFSKVPGSGGIVEFRSR
jgi:hypothetical protein